jgi:hypothetical protein
LKRQAFSGGALWCVALASFSGVTL